MTSYFLRHGSHQTREDGLCAMEWVSYLAGEKHSDAPECVSPMLTGFCVSLNDALPDDQRQRLRPYLARTIGTRGDGLDDSRRWMCADWLIREYVPTFLELVPSLRSDAEALRSLPSILAVENVQRAMVDLNRARQRADAAWDAAWRALPGPLPGALPGALPGSAAWDAAWDAAWTAARTAAGDAAWTAAGDAAWTAAGDAARTAAGSAAGAALAPSVLVLQNSVLSPGGLLDRMLPLEPLVLASVSEWREVCDLVA